MTNKIDNIITTACDAFMVGREALLSPLRTKQVSWARHALCKILSEQYGLNDHEIGKHLGRDRTTASHCRKAASALYGQNKLFRDAYHEAMDNLGLTAQTRQSTG